MKGITRDSLNELIDRKVIWIFAAVVLFGILGTFLTTRIESSFQMGTATDMNMEQMNEAFGNPVLQGFHQYMSFLVFLAVMASAGLFPRMLEKGRAEFFLSKPLSHASLFANKFLGVWLVYGGTVLGCGLVIYLAVGLAHGIFDLTIIYLQLFWLIGLLLWMAVTSFFGILTGSTVIAIMAAFLIWVAEKVLSARGLFSELIGSDLLAQILDTVYYVLPNPSATSDIFLAIVMRSPVLDWKPLWTTAVFSLLLLYASIVLMRRKDF